MTIALAASFKRIMVRNLRSAFLAAFACASAGAFLFYRAWDEGLRAGERDLHLWQFAFGGIALLASAISFVACALCWGRQCARSGLYDFGRKDVPHRRWMPFVLSAGCLLLFAGFHQMNLWTMGFDEPGWRYVAYNAFRLAFMCYLAVALVGTGRCVLILAERRWGEWGLGPVEYALAAFFAGAAVWFAALYPLGLLGLLVPSVIVPAFAMAVWFSWPIDYLVYRHLRDVAQHWLAETTLLRVLLLGSSLGIILPLWLQVLVTRGLAVTGFEYDSSGHYLPYYQAVVSNGSTDVNELWYHFWISKGAGLHFVSVMFTDIQGTQLVSFTFLSAAVLTLVMLIRRVSGSLTFGIAAGGIFLAPFAYSFPFYQKLHIVTTALVGGLLWIATLSWLRADLNARVSLVALSLLALAAVLHAPPLAALICPFLAITLFAQRVAGRSEKAAAWSAAIPAAVALAAACGVLWINYVETGLMEVTPFRFFWKLADQSAFSKLASPYLMLFLEEGSSRATEVPGLLGGIDPYRLARLLHMHFLSETFLFASLLMFVSCAGACLFDRRTRQSLGAGLAPAAVMLATAAVLGILIRQPGSIDRFYVFALLPLTYLAAAVPGVAVRRLQELQLNGFSRYVRQWIVVAIIGSAIAFSGLSAAQSITRYFEGSTFASFLVKLRFALGGLSFEQALVEKRQPPDPVDWPRQDLSETCLGIRSALLGRGEGSGIAAESWPKVWTMTFLQESGCHIMPGVRILMEVSNRFGERWHRIVFGDPATAEHELRRIGIRYVFVNLGERNNQAKTGESTSIFGCLAYSPLLASPSLESRFRIAWSDGDAYLLVLASEGEGRPLPRAFGDRLNAKRNSVAPGFGDMHAMCTRLAAYYRTFDEKWPVHTDPTLPALKGWQ